MQSITFIKITIQKKIEEKIMHTTDWEKAAIYILEQEKVMNVFNCPESVGVVIKWKDDIYIGSIQEIVPEFSKEIVLLSKSTNKLPDGLVNAIRKLDEKRLELDADKSLDLKGRQHILRRIENRLVLMNSQQTEYMMKNLPKVFEIDKN